MTIRFDADACYRTEYDYATSSYTGHFKNEPTMFRAGFRAVSVGHGNEIAAQFPKFVNVKVNKTTGYVSFYVTLYANGINDGKNEAGIKRIKRFLEIAGELEWKKPAVNSYESLEDFKAHVLK